METRCPEGAGQGQRSWPGAQHDSPDSRQGSRPASAKSVRKYQQQNYNEQEQKTSPRPTAEKELPRQTARPKRP
ncbi:hypothetical protein DPS92_24205 [Salmonella enterica subsp. enterica serovar Richmond]|nr:hypothetical protein [Salmonella enterica subsp. enterica serovar Richmond]EAC1168375.1 hypothetical protein [Salmonella enterica subsp. enterica serovar Typhimurium]EBL6678449.1 hypothetical protein [Salmonella enterica]EBY6939059.1 hypothetical protein [Salmonella enterica subsp. enterica serovar Newport]EBZ2758204.1 hypothetical protein [Salmonella enterica subsp. enterica serovar Pomona]ECH8956721.1 hypothetical protein [Salmonella enterica subsp. enterica serovar Hvittingfoss]